jgi:hypothetical protein
VESGRRRGLVEFIIAATWRGACLFYHWGMVALMNSLLERMEGSQGLFPGNPIHKINAIHITTSGNSDANS